MAAVEQGNTEIVLALIAHGADVNAVAGSGANVLAVAARRPANNEIVGLLKQAGAK